MAIRVGPDQSVNSPRVLQSLLGKVRYLVDLYSALKEASDAQDFDLSNIQNPSTLSMSATPASRLLHNVYIPLRLSNGETLNYGSDYAAGATLSEAIFSNNLDEKAPAPDSRATIKTYENLAEFFRTGWGQINQFPLLLSNYTATGNSTVINPAGTISSGCSFNSSTGIKSESENIRMVDSTNFEIKTVSFSFLFGGSFEPKATPIWLGSGPNSYLDTTYPQLRDEFDKLTPFPNISVDDSNLTDYIYLVTKRVSGRPFPTGTGEPKELYLQSNFGVSIYNPSTTDSISITVSANNSASHGNLIFAPGTGRGCELFCQARIVILDEDDNPLITTDNNSKVVIEAPSTGTNSGSNSESATESIPPLGRAVCRVQSRVSHQEPIVGVSQPFGAGSCTININGVSLSRSADLGFYGTPC